MLKGLLSLSYIILFISCNPSYYRKVSSQDYPENVTAPDYSQLSLWAAHPYKHDPSDSIPRPFRKAQRDSAVDVFFLHPTTFTDPSRIEEFNGTLDDDSLNAKTDYTSILYQASVFNGQARIFAPRYRQAHLGMYTYHDTARAMEAFDTAYADIRKAFQYYLDHYSGKPIIIASHSQGTQHAKRLLKEFFDNKPLQKQLVAAYLVGIGVKKDEFQTIPICTDSLQTGCFLGWRTFRRDYEGPYYISQEPEMAVVNPLTWRADSSYAPKTLHKGAILYKFNKLVRQPHDAQVHKNILWISRPHFAGGFLYKSRNYHVGDYNLFYHNIREDVRRRVRHYTERLNRPND